MKRRTLGRGGPKVSEIGLGCWQFGGDFGPMTEATAHEIMTTAVESGVDFFDTADVYGGGQSEAWIGSFLASSGAEVRVASKFGRDGVVYPDKYGLQAMRDSVRRQLDRLGVEALELLQLHCVPTEVMADGEIFDWLRTLQQEGLIRHFGASIETIDEGLLCIRQEGIRSLQVIFNLFRQRAVEELLPQAQAAGVGVIVRLPLASGLLSGKFTASTSFAEGDHRNYNRDGQLFNVGETFSGLPFEVGCRLAAELRALLPADAPMAASALRWCLDQESVTTLIPGASRVEHAAANAAASELEPLPPELHERLRAFYWESVHEHVRGAY